MGASGSRTLPARLPVPAGKTRVCVAGFTLSHHTGRARKVMDAIVKAHPDTYEVSSRSMSRFMAFVVAHPRHDQALHVIAAVLVLLRQGRCVPRTQDQANGRAPTRAEGAVRCADSACMTLSLPVSASPTR